MVGYNSTVAALTMVTAKPLHNKRMNMYVAIKGMLTRTIAMPAMPQTTKTPTVELIIEILFVFTF